MVPMKIFGRIITLHENLRIYISLSLFFRSSMHETVSTLTALSNSLETGSYDSPSQDQSSKLPIHLIAEQLKSSINEFDSIRGRLELKDEEILDLKKLLKIKQDELSEVNIRLSLNEKKIESLQKELEDKESKHKQLLEEGRIDGQKKIK